MLMTNGQMRMTHNYELDEPTTILQQGGLILFPTDTVWGIGCDACNVEAVTRLRQLQRFDAQEPLTILVNSIDMLKQYVVHLHPRLETLLIHHVRPITIVYEAGRGLPDAVAGADGSIAIRLTLSDYCKNLIEAVGNPIVATPASMQANDFPTNFGAVSSAIIEKVDHVVKYRQDEKTPHEPSVMVKLSEKSELIFLRE